MATPTSALGKVIKEEIPRGIREYRGSESAIWDRIKSNSTGVSTGLGRDWKFIEMWATGLAGHYEFTSHIAGATMAANYADVNQAGLGNKWPARSETTLPAFFSKETILKEAKGKVMFPAKWAELDEFPSSIGSAVKLVMKRSALKAAKAHALSFWTTDATYFKLVTNLQTSSSAGAHAITINNSSASAAHGRIRMLDNGLTVDVIDGTAHTVTNNGPCVVRLLNPLAGTFTITQLSGANFAITAGDYLSLRNSAGNQPAGIHSWMKNSGTIFDGSIDLAVHPEFSSLIATESGPATEDMLTKYIGSFVDLLGAFGIDLDTVVTTAGVTHAYLANEGNLAWYDRNGRRMSVKGGWANIDYAYEGSAFDWAMDRYCQYGGLYVLKTRNNIQEKVPPPVPGMGSKGEFGNEVKFVAPLGGYSDIFMFERDSSDAQIVDNLEAPYRRICQLTCEQPQGIILTGLQETNATNA